LETGLELGLDPCKLLFDELAELRDLLRLVLVAVLVTNRLEGREVIGDDFSE
jgi:hypothetical protein